MEQQSPNQNYLDKVDEILKQNEIILRMNEILIKSFSRPAWIIKKDERIGD